MKNLIKLYLWPLIKRFKALFITMAALTAVGVTAIIAFNGISNGIDENYNRYKDISRAPHAFVNTSFTNYESKDIINKIENIKGVDEAESFIYLPCSTYLPSTKERKAGTKSTQLFTFDKDYDKYQPTFYEKARYKKDITNVYVEKSFANLNKIHANQTLMIGYYEHYVKVNVCGIVSYPDTVVYGASNAASSENNNFGRIYVEKHQISWLYSSLVQFLEDKMTELAFDGNDLGLWDAEYGVPVSVDTLIGNDTYYDYRPDDYFRVINSGDLIPKGSRYDIESDDNTQVYHEDVEILQFLKFDGTEWLVQTGTPSSSLQAAANYLDMAKKFKGFISDQSQEFANRITVYFAKNANQRDTLDRVRSLLKSEGIKVTESYIFDDSLSASIINSSAIALKSAGAAISIFVFATTIIVLTMFLLQIIREMMRDIGVMQAIGIQKEHIMVLLSLFSLIMAIIGTAFGVFFGHLIELGLDKIVGGVFGIAAKAPPVRWATSGLSFALVILASQFATLFASFRITKLTPVDALNDQASNKKVLPPSIDKKLQKSSPGVRLTVNSIVTKPKRFITSFLAIFSTSIIIFTAIASLASFKTALNNIFSKYIRYDAQVVFAGDAPEGFEDELQDMDLKKKDYELTGYGTINLKYKDQEMNVPIQGIQPNSDMFYLPTKGNDHTPLPESGITVNMITAKDLGIEAGDYVLVNDEKVKVAYITQFEAYDACFCKISDINKYSNNAVDSYLIKNVSKEKLLVQMTNYHFDSMVTFTDDQKSYFTSRFRVLEMCCYVFIAFAVGLGMIIVSLMMQTSLQEQRRDLCIMRSVGFSMGQISGIWSFVTILQYIFSSIFAIPLAFVTTKVLLGFTATKMAMVLSYANWIHAVITLLIVAAFLVLSQAFCMLKVKKWNIADNTKNRE